LRAPYGPSLVAGAKGELLSKAFGQAVERYASGIRFVSQKLGAKTVAELERTATALYISLREPRVAEIAERLTNVKPHITLQEARAAVSEVEQISSEFQLRPVALKRA